MDLECDGKTNWALHDEQIGENQGDKGLGKADIGPNPCYACYVHNTSTVSTSST